MKASARTGGVAEYVDVLVRERLADTTSTPRVAAIGCALQLATIRRPTDDPVVTTTLAGGRRLLAGRANAKPPRCCGCAPDASFRTSATDALEQLRRKLPGRSHTALGPPRSGSATVPSSSWHWS
jgi:hypothetical protein